MALGQTYNRRSETTTAEFFSYDLLQVYKEPLVAIVLSLKPIQLEKLPLIAVEPNMSLLRKVH